jgi:hypothetical protein
MWKRVAGRAEKISAGSMLIGIFQNRLRAVLFGLQGIIAILRLERSIK